MLKFFTPKCYAPRSYANSIQKADENMWPIWRKPDLSQFYNIFVIISLKCMLWHISGFGRMGHIYGMAMTHQVRWLNCRWENSQSRTWSGSITCSALFIALLVAAISSTVTKLGWVTQRSYKKTPSNLGSSPLLFNNRIHARPYQVLYHN